MKQHPTPSLPHSGKMVELHKTNHLSDIDKLLETCELLQKTQDFEKILRLTHEILSEKTDIPIDKKSSILNFYVYAAISLYYLTEALEVLEKHFFSDVSLYSFESQIYLLRCLLVLYSYGGFEEGINQNFDLLKNSPIKNLSLELLYYHPNQTYYREYTLELLKNSPPQGEKISNSILYILSSLNIDSPSNALAAIMPNEEVNVDTPVRRWLLYQISRLYTLPISDLCTLSSDIALQIEKNPFPYNPIPTYTSTHASLPKMNSEIRIHPNSIKSNLQIFFNIINKMKEEGEFDSCIQNIQNAKEHLSNKQEDPVFVLSTGRCGTTSLYEIFKTEDKYLSYHSYNYQIHPRDRNHILYRILLGQFEGEHFKTIIRLFVQSRTAELLYAYANNQIPMFLGHWDSVLSPVWSVIFPNAKFIHLERSAVDVFKSFYIKKQWFNNQLQPLKFGFSDAGKFHQSHNENLTKTEKISWYLHITKVFSQSFLELLPADNKMYLNADNLFNADMEEYSRLQTFLDLKNISTDFMKEFFEVPINTKTYKKTHVDDIEGALLHMQKCLNHLEKTGFLPD